MKLRPIRLTWLAIIAILGVVAFATVRATANTVASSHVSNTTQGVTVNELKPPECDGINLTAKVQGTGDFEGGSANELLLGAPSTQRIRGRDGNDCVVGGGGADELEGDAGTDVCIGSQTATFKDCETTVRR